MKPKVLVAMLCLIGLCLGGCIQPPPEPQPAVQVDPFNIQINPNAPVCPPGCCPCPDGQCPYPYGLQNQIGSEVSSDVSATSSIDVNAIAATEVKGDPGDESKENPACIPCLKRVPISNPIVQPTAIAQPTAKSSLADQVKHGAFRCEMCQQATVGSDWEDLWADDGTSLHCLCKGCFAKASPVQKEAALNAFINRSDPALKNNPSIRSAIKSVSQR